MTFQTSRQTAARSMDAWNWLAVPTLTCLMLTLILALPVRVFGLVPPEPIFLMVPAFVWAVIRPSILPPIILMVSGLLLDILWGAPWVFGGSRCSLAMPVFWPRGVLPAGKGSR